MVPLFVELRQTSPCLPLLPPLHGNLTPSRRDFSCLISWFREQSRFFVLDAVMRKFLMWFHSNPIQPRSTSLSLFIAQWIIVISWNPTQAHFIFRHRTSTIRLMREKAKENFSHLITRCYRKTDESERLEASRNYQSMASADFLINLETPF